MLVGSMSGCRCGGCGCGLQVVFLRLDNFPVVLNLMSDGGLFDVPQAAESWIPYGVLWFAALVVRLSSLRIAAKLDVPGDMWKPWDAVERRRVWLASSIIVMRS